MKTVPRLRVVSSPDSPELEELLDLSDEVRLALSGIAEVAREALLAMSVAAGMAVMATMFDAEITAACGPKGKHNPSRTAARHAPTRRRATPTRTPHHRPKQRNCRYRRLTSRWDRHRNSTRLVTPSS